MHEGCILRACVHVCRMLNELIGVALTTDVHSDRWKNRQTTR